MSPEIRSKRRSNKRSWNPIHIRTKDQSDSGVCIKAASVHGGTQTGYWAKIGPISIPPWPHLTPAHGFVPNVTLSACRWNFKATMAHFLLSSVAEFLWGMLLRVHWFASVGTVHSKILNPLPLLERDLFMVCVDLLKWLLLSSLLPTFIAKIVKASFSKSSPLYGHVLGSWYLSFNHGTGHNFVSDSVTSMTQSLETHPGEKGSPIFRSRLKLVTPSWPVSWPRKSEPGLVWRKWSLSTQRSKVTTLTWPEKTWHLNHRRPETGLESSSHARCERVDKTDHISVHR